MAVEPAMAEASPLTPAHDSKTPKLTKGLRFYYRHREELLQQRKQKRLEDPEYQKKVQAREEAKKAKEEARIAKEEARKQKEELKRAKEAEREAKRRATAILVGALAPSGSN